LATLESVSRDRLVARLDDGRRVAWNPREYESIAHGYAVTIHKSQGATVDRTYVMADERMNRNVSYVALTRHREELHVYADRATFPDREQLDRALSRAEAKDLARDYGVAALERQAERIAPLLRHAEELRAQGADITDRAQTLERADSLVAKLEEYRSQFQEALGRVYADPLQAEARILADPRAAERLAHGEAAAFGPIRGRPAGTIRPANQVHKDAQIAVPAVQRALASYQTVSAQATAARAAALRVQGLLSTPSTRLQAAAQPPRGQSPGNYSPSSHITTSGSGGLPELRMRAHQVRQAIRTVEQSLEGPAKILEAAVREVGAQAVRVAIAALPPPLRLPVQIALRANERIVDLGRELSR
jgi:hypothetical protein